MRQGLQYVRSSEVVALQEEESIVALGDVVGYGLTTRLAFEDAGDDLGKIGLVALGDEMRLPWPRRGLEILTLLRPAPAGRRISQARF